MAIIRTFHDKENPYTTLNNQALFDPNLSNAARGLWAQCMARRDDWTFYMSEMANNTKDGKEALYTQINELIHAGYAGRLQVKERKGGKLVFKSVDYIFFESRITPEKKAQFLEHFKKQLDWCEFMEPKPKGVNNKQEVIFKKCLSQTGFPDTELPDTENPPLVNTNSKSTDQESTEDIIAPRPTDMPAGGNNNFFKSLDSCYDLSDRQKRLLMKYPEPLVDQAVKYAYHPTTQIEGGPIGRIKLLQYFLKNPDHFTEKMENLDKPAVRKSKKDLLLGKFKRGETYNGYEFIQDDIGVGFYRSGMYQPYSVRWDARSFANDFLEVLKKCGIEP